MQKESTPENSIIKFSVSRIWTKPYMQQVLKELRGKGYDIEKVASGYSVRNPSDENQLVLRAMIGQKGYLVRYSEPLFFGDDEYDQKMDALLQAQSTIKN